MTENNTETKTTLLDRAKVVGAKLTNPKVLAVVAVTSVTVNVLQGRAISQHNTFLKEHGLFDAFYDLASTEVA